MAYVIYVIAHPDQDEPFTIEKSGLAHTGPITLLLEDGHWQVHYVGGDAIPPQELGKEPYFW